MRRPCGCSRLSRRRSCPPHETAAALLSSDQCELQPRVEGSHRPGAVQVDPLCLCQPASRRLLHQLAAQAGYSPPLPHYDVLQQRILSRSCHHCEANDQRRRGGGGGGRCGGHCDDSVQSVTQQRGELCGRLQVRKGAAAMLGGVQLQQLRQMAVSHTVLQGVRGLMTTRGRCRLCRRLPRRCGFHAEMTQHPLTMASLRAK